MSYRGCAACMFATAIMLAGCASPASLPPGASADQVREALGRPDAVHALADGQRLEYTVGPYQQTTYMVDLNRGGVVRAITQVRTLDNFFRLRPGQDTADSLRRDFGQPWKVEHYRLSGLTAWLYPHLEAGVFNSMVAVHVDSSGVVQSVQNGLDPRFLGGNNRDE